MRSNAINKVKLYFTVVAGLVVVGMFIGISSLAGSPYTTTEYLGGRIAYAKYWLDFNINNKALAANIFGGLENAPIAYVSDGKTSASVPILVYHGITEKDDGSNGINTTVDRFKSQMFALKRAGYETITTGDLLRYMRGEIELPPKSVMVTFDDGRRDSFYNADPILSALGYEAVMFVITNYSLDTKSDYYLSAEEIEHMEKTGRWDNQPHTHKGHETISIDASGKQGNFFSSKMWLPSENRLETDEEYARRVEADMRTSKERLEEVIGKETVAFAFPFGDYGQGMTNYTDAESVLLMSASKYYKLLFYQHAPGVHYLANYRSDQDAQARTFLLRRFDYNRHFAERDFLGFVNSVTGKTLPYSDDLTEDRGWIKAWGDVSVDAGSLRLVPNSGKAGAAAILDGTGHWKDYVASATVNDPDRNSVYMWIRFDTEENNAACNFGEGFAHIEQTVDGVKRVIKGVRNENINIPEGDAKVTARVSGRNVECTLEGEVTVATEFLDEELDIGGIGFKTWDELQSQRGIIIKDILVQENG